MSEPSERHRRPLPAANRFEDAPLTSIAHCRPPLLAAMSFTGDRLQGATQHPWQRDLEDRRGAGQVPDVTAHRVPSLTNDDQ